MNTRCKKGDKFGLLLVKETWTEKHNRKSKETVCKCLCDCGNTVTTLAMYLKNGHKKSCGCLRKKMVNKKHPKWMGCGDISGQFWAAIKGSARRRKPVQIPFEITIDEAWSLYQKQQGRCALSGVRIEFAPKSSKKGTASLDRINSSESYCINNVQWVHKDVNLMKNSLDEDQFIKWCNTISNHLAIRVKPTAS